MIPAIKKRWLEALRSGKYKQAQGKLHDGKRFCCLGVLYDTEFDGDWTRPDESYTWSNSDEWMIDNESEQLSDTFKAECQIDDATEGELINMNDQDGQNFDKIAAWI